MRTITTVAGDEEEGGASMRSKRRAAGVLAVLGER